MIFIESLFEIITSYYYLVTLYLIIIYCLFRLLKKIKILNKKIDNWLHGDIGYGGEPPTIIEYVVALWKTKI